MATSLRSWMMRRVRQGLTALTLGAATITFSGCNLLDSSTYTSTSHSVAPTGQPREIVAYWDKSLQMAPDPTRAYQMSPCVVGRMILLGPDSKPVCCDGTVTVVLYDERPAQGGVPVALESWTINNENLKKMVSMDSLRMWGYTLALPTETCRPNVGRVRLDVQFKPDHAEGALFAASSDIRMNYGDFFQRNGGAVLARNQQGQPQSKMMPAGSAQPQQMTQQPVQPQPQLAQQMPPQPMPQQGPQMPSPVTAASFTVPQAGVPSAPVAGPGQFQPMPQLQFQGGAQQPH